MADLEGLVQRAVKMPTGSVYMYMLGIAGSPDDEGDERALIVLR
jgi:hypothetical protein